MIKTFISLFATCFCLFSAVVCGGMPGKIDLGPSILSVDVLESGKTIETLHMKGFKGDATVLLYQGAALKGGCLFGWGDGTLSSGSIAAGYYIPVGYFFPVAKCLKILPNVGFTFSYLSTRVSFKELGLLDLRERFRSTSPFIGIDICYSITEKLTLMGVYQYAWCRTHTRIKPIVSQKSHSCGPNYGLSLDYWFSEHWSVNFGVGYNISLSKEKHGLRGKGAKLGLAYYF